MLNIHVTYVFITLNNKEYDSTCSSQVAWSGGYSLSFPAHLSFLNFMFGITVRMLYIYV